MNSDDDNVKVPVQNVVLRNPFFGIKDHPYAGVKVIIIEKIDNFQENEAIEQLIIENELDPTAEDIFLSTMIGLDDRGYSNVISPEQRYNTVETFIRKGWKIEDL
jgi:hypothetical protein